MIPARGPQTKFSYIFLYLLKPHVFYLASCWARLSTGASREASVDNECLGKSMQVGGSRELGVQAKLFATGLDT